MKKPSIINNSGRKASGADKNFQGNINASLLELEVVEARKYCIPDETVVLINDCDEYLNSDDLNTDTFWKFACDFEHIFTCAYEC